MPKKRKKRTQRKQNPPFSEKSSTRHYTPEKNNNDFFGSVDNEFNYISSRLNELFSRVHSVFRSLTGMGDPERSLPDRSHSSSSFSEYPAPPMLPEKIPERNHFDLVNFNSEVLRRFMFWRNDPLVETAIDERRGELRILVLMPGVKKEDIELELTENTVIVRSLAGEDGDRNITVPLPVPVKMRSIETSYANGVLQVKLKLKSSKRYYKVKIK
jgi:HSP20 family molecular chaperone IbpA